MRKYSLIVLFHGSVVVVSRLEGSSLSLNGLSDELGSCAEHVLQGM